MLRKIIAALSVVGGLAQPLFAQAVYKQSTAAHIMVFMRDSADHLTGKTGLTLTCTASKNGGAFAAVTPTVTERGNGWYDLLTATGTMDTVGDLAFHVTGTGADANDFVVAIRANQLGDTLPVNVTQCNGTTVPAPNYVCGPVTIVDGAEDTTTSVSNTGFSGDILVGYRIAIKYHTTGLYYWRRISSLDPVTATINWTTPLGFTPSSLDTAWVFSDAPQLEDIRTAALTTIPAATTAIKAQTDKLTFDGSNHVAVQNGTGSGQVPQVSDLLGTTNGSATVAAQLAGSFNADQKAQLLAALSLDQEIGVPSALQWIIERKDGAIKGNATIVKSASDEVDVAADFRKVLATGDAIKSEADGGIVAVDLITTGSGLIDSTAFSDVSNAELWMNSAVRFHLTGGTNGTTYTIRVKVLTVGGSTLSADCQVKVNGN